MISVVRKYFSKYSVDTVKQVIDIKQIVINAAGKNIPGSAKLLVESCLSDLMCVTQYHGFASIQFRPSPAGVLAKSAQNGGISAHIRISLRYLPDIYIIGI